MAMFSAFARMEWIADITLDVINKQYELPSPGTLPMDRFMAGLYLMWEGRITMPATGMPTAEMADGRFALIDTLTVQGTHRVRRSDEQFINLRGPDIRQLQRIYQIHAPHSTPTSFTLTASATNDTRYILYLPFYPMGLPLRSSLMHILDAPNYERLRLTVRYSDTKSVFSGQTNEPTFSAFNSASGSPKLRVFGQFTMGGPGGFPGFVPTRVWRYFSENASADMTATGTRIRVREIPRGERIRNVLLKTGAKATGVTSGNTAFNTLSDTILQEIKVMRGTNKVIRHYTDFFIPQEEIAGKYGLAPSSGYALLDFAPHGSLEEALDTRDLIAGSTGDTDLFIQADVTGAANQATVAIFEELRGGPASVLRR